MRGQSSPLFMKGKMNIGEKIEHKVNEILGTDTDLFLVDVSLKGHRGNQKLIVTLDGEKGINIDQCAEVSRKLGRVIEEENIIDGKYLMEVSSAGMGVPIKIPRQYKRFIGRTLSITLKSGEKFSGILKNYSEEGLEVEINQEKVFYNFKDIQKSIVEVSFK